MLRAAICIKNKEKREYICSGIGLLSYDINVKTFRNFYDFREEFDEQQTGFDIVILDTTIQREGDGIELAEYVRLRNRKLMILFVTESREYYEQAFHVFATGYLRYPFDVKDLGNCIDFYFQKTGVERRASCMLKEKGGNWCRIFCRNIRYIESDNREIFVHLEDGTVIESYAKLSQVEQELPEAGFTRCHQSYIVNLYFVDEMKSNLFVIREDEIPISRKYQKEVKEVYYDYMFSKM